MLLASTHLTNGKPTILALGAKHARGQYKCEHVIVSPTPGASGAHTPIPAGPLEFRWYADRDANERIVTLDWPGLTSGVGVKTRWHQNIILSTTPNGGTI